MNDLPGDTVTTAPTVLTSVEGRVLVIRLHRPAAVNAIDTAMVTALREAVDRLDSSPDLAAGVLTGEGPDFCSGMDLKAFAKEGLPRGLHEFYATGSRKPLVAAVEGVAWAGGLELALTCDLLVASGTATFGIPEVKVGLFAAGGGLIRLPRRVGYGTAMQLALTGDPIDADTALRRGLVTTVTEPGGALPEALRLAGRIAANAPLAVAASKKLVEESLTRTEEEFWQHQRADLRVVVRSEDAREGPRAFAGKRPPNWTGR